jgi:hypothetical protein
VSRGQRTPSNFRQGDVARAIKAAKIAGLDIVRVEVDPKTARITLVTKDDGESELKINPFDKAPADWPTGKRKKKCVSE